MTAARGILKVYTCPLAHQVGKPRGHACERAATAHVGGVSPTGCSPKEKAYETEIRSDLENLRYAQEQFRVDSGRFAHSIDEIGSAFVMLRDVTISIDRADSVLFTATGGHALLAERACHLEVGEATRDSLWCYDR